jgi:hypothetical protein
LLLRVEYNGNAEQEVVPDVGELEDADNDEGRCRQRQHDLAEDAHESGAVNPRGLDQLVRHVREVVAEDERGDRDTVDNVHEHEALPPPVEIEEIHRLDHRDQDRLVGDEHPEEDQGEDDVRPLELPLRKQVAIDRADDRRQDGGRDDDPEAGQ